MPVQQLTSGKCIFASGRIGFGLFQLFFLWLSVCSAFSQSADSTQFSGIYLKAANLVRKDEVILDLTPGNEYIAVMKLDNPGITLALGTGSERFSIAGPATVMSGEMIPLNLRRAGNQFSIKLKKIGPHCENYLYFLKDDDMNQIYPFTSDSLEIPFNQTGAEENRFSLILQEIISHVSGSELKNPVVKSLELILQEKNVRITDFSGRTIPFSRSAARTSNLSPGLYYLSFPDRRRNFAVLIP